MLLVAYFQKGEFMYLCNSEASVEVLADKGRHAALWMNFTLSMITGIVTPTTCFQSGCKIIANAASSED